MIILRTFNDDELRLELLDDQLDDDDDLELELELKKITLKLVKNKIFYQLLLMHTGASRGGFKPFDHDGPLVIAAMIDECCGISHDMFVCSLVRTWTLLSPVR
jgi:hypothetical protein